jgi:hypothetical protein
MNQVEMLAQLLREAEMAHAAFEAYEKAHPSENKMEWPEFYAQYILSTHPGFACGKY